MAELCTINTQDWFQGLQQLPPSRHAVLVSITDTAGSTPRTRGSRMLVTADSQFDTIGGGHLEWKALATARLWLNEPLHQTPSPRIEKLALGANLGQCCGGVVQLSLERLDQLSDADYDARMLYWQRCQPPKPQLLLFGAGHVGAALVQVLAQVPCQITWVDERDHLFPEQLPAHVTVEATDVPEAVIAAAAPGSYYLVMTHHHGLDLRLCEHILKRADAAWFGLIGSRSKRAQFEHRLRARDVSETALQAMCCPIGVPGIAGKEPGVIAVSVAAQLLQLWSAKPTLAVSPVSAKTTA